MKQGEQVRLGGIGVICMVSGDDTQGGFAVVEHPLEPGTLVPPHVHEREDEFSVVIEGVFGVRVGDEITEALGPGECVFKPRGIPHTFWNPSSGVSRLLDVIAPAGFENFFPEMAAIVAAGGGTPDPAQLEALGNKYKQFYVEGWAEELESRYGVTLLGPRA
jgi:mannose-6-phosphate isomerase-like protein (cupin superfamily)